VIGSLFGAGLLILLIVWIIKTCKCCSENDRIGGYSMNQLDAEQANYYKGGGKGVSNAAYEL
jgi:hypothetical protein